jgi:hypothetical protein
MKPTTKQPASAAEAFYAAPSPARAVALAIADHQALNKFPMWDYVAQLQRARDRAEAYPKLIEALRKVLVNSEAMRSMLSEHGFDQTPVESDAEAAAGRTRCRSMNNTRNFKRPGMAVCAQGHLHRTPDSAATCDSAWRYTMRKSLRADELMDALRKVLDASDARNSTRGKS